MTSEYLSIDYCLLNWGKHEIVHSSGQYFKVHKFENTSSIPVNVTARGWTEGIASSIPMKITVGYITKL